MELNCKVVKLHMERHQYIHEANQRKKQILYIHTHLMDGHLKLVKLHERLHIQQHIQEHI